jgi:nucleotide-binding universal stress UspA family protein
MARHRLSSEHGGMSRTLVFGDDGSAGADGAWEWLAARRWSGWHAKVLTADPRWAGPPRGPELPSSRVQERKAPEADFASISHHVVEGDPREVLETSPADLRVVGPRGGGALKALHLGSTADWLLRAPSNPLLIARTPMPGQRIMVCADGSEHAEAAVTTLLTFPWIRDMEFLVIGVADGHPGIEDAVGRSADRLAAVSSQVARHVIPKDPLSIFINVRAVLFDTIKAYQPDLVVMGTQGLTGLNRLWVGSVAGAVAHHAPCSVLLARASS